MVAILNIYRNICFERLIIYDRAYCNHTMQKLIKTA